MRRLFLLCLFCSGLPEATPYGWGTYRAVILPAGTYRIDIVKI